MGSNSNEELPNLPEEEKSERTKTLLPLRIGEKGVPYPSHTVHIDHKGPLNPMRDGKHHCLVVIDALLCFNQVYPVQSTDATHTSEAMSIFTISFGIPQKLVYGRGTSFMSTNFFTLILEFGITHAPRTNWSSWTNRKIELRNRQLSRCFRCYLSEAGNNWSKLACQFAFAYFTSNPLALEQLL